MEKEKVIRKELLALMVGSHAHMNFEEVIDDFPISRINDKAPNMPYAPWHILEHMRRAQEDIVLFIQDPGFESPPWPQGYFPSPSERTDKAGWNKIIQDFLADRAVLEKMVQDLETDLFAPILHAPAYTIYREILVVADHNAYHTGEMAFMRQAMKTWPPGEELYDATG